MSHHCFSSDYYNLTSYVVPRIPKYFKLPDTSHLSYQFYSVFVKNVLITIFLAFLCLWIYFSRLLPSVWTVFFLVLYLLNKLIGAITKHVFSIVTRIITLCSIFTFAQLAIVKKSREFEEVLKPSLYYSCFLLEVDEGGVQIW